MAGCGAVPAGGVGRWAVAAARLQPTGSREASAARASPCGIVQGRTEYAAGVPRPRATKAQRKHRAIPAGPRKRLVVPYYSAAWTAPAAKWTTTAVMLSVLPKA